MNLARRPAAFSAVLLTAGALGAGVALAASGDQDPSFNGGTPAVVNFPNGSQDLIRDLAVGPTHAISLLSTDRYDRDRAYVSGGSVVVGRVASDGTPIDTFGEHGFVTDPFEDMRSNGASAIAVDKDDNTLVGFSSGDEPPVEEPPTEEPPPVDSWGGDEQVDGDFTVVRYLPDGSSDGVSRVHLAGALDATLIDVVPQADGSTLVAGYVTNGEGGHSVVIRLNAEGTQDLGYGTGGEATIPDAYMIGAGSQPAGPAGSIVTVSGLGTNEATNSFEQIVVRRFLADGSVDPNYGGTFPNTVGGYFYNGLKSFVGRDGRAYLINVYGRVVARYGTDGQPDTGYGTNGLLTLGDELYLSSPETVGADAQADGKLVITGFPASQAGKDNAAGALVARYKADGSGLDPEFADGGLFHLPLPNDPTADAAYANQVAVQDDGKIVVGGSFGRNYESTVELRALEPGEGQSFVLRLGEAGTVTTPTETTTTGTTTQATTPAPTVTAAAKPVAAQSTAAPKACASRRTFKIRLRIPHGKKPVSAVVRVNGKKVKTLTGKRITAPVDLRGLAKGQFTVSITVKLNDGKSLKGARKYKTCTPKGATTTIPVL